MMQNSVHEYDKDLSLLLVEFLQWADVKKERETAVSRKKSTAFSTHFYHLQKNLGDLTDENLL